MYWGQMRFTGSQEPWSLRAVRVGLPWGRETPKGTWCSHTSESLGALLARMGCGIEDRGHSLFSVSHTAVLLRGPGGKSDP